MEISCVLLTVDLVEITEVHPLELVELEETEALAVAEQTEQPGPLEESLLVAQAARRLQRGAEVVLVADRHPR